MRLWLLAIFLAPILAASILGFMAFGTPLIQNALLKVRGLEPCIVGLEKTTREIISLYPGTSDTRVYQMYTRNVKNFNIIVKGFSNELQFTSLSGEPLEKAPYSLSPSTWDPESQYAVWGFKVTAPQSIYPGEYGINLAIKVSNTLFSKVYSYIITVIVQPVKEVPPSKTCLTITLDKETYFQGETMQITIKNISNETIWFANTACNLYFERFNGACWEFYDSMIGGLAITPLQPNETKQFTWKLSYNGRPYPSGRYRVGTKGVYAEFEVIENILNASSDVFILKTDKMHYTRGESVKMTFINGGDETVRFRQVPPFIIKNQQGVVVAPSLLLGVILELLPGGSYSLTWDQINRFLDPPGLVPAGNYTVTVEVYNSTWGLITTLSTDFEIRNIKPRQAELEKIVIEFFKTTDVPNGGWNGTVKVKEIYDHKLGATL